MMVRHKGAVKYKPKTSGRSRFNLDEYRDEQIHLKLDVILSNQKTITEKLAAIIAEQEAEDESK